MSEGREVLGYTLIRRNTSGRKEYLKMGGGWSQLATKALPCSSTMSYLLQRIAYLGERLDACATYHLGRVVRIPGKQTVEQILEPEAECMWGCRIVCEAYAPWRGPRESTSRNPIPMTLADAESVRDMTDARYIVPLRVTHSEPRTVVEEVECG